MRLDLVFSMRDIYMNSNLNPLTKFTSSSRSTKLKDILPWNISQIIMKTIPVSTRIVISYAMKWGIWLWISWKAKSMETDTITWSEFSNGGKAIVEQILVSQERKKSKRAGLWESQSGIWVGNLTTSMHEHGTKTTPVILPVDGEASWLLLTSLARKHLFLYPQGDRSSLRNPKKDNHQH